MTQAERDRLVALKKAKKKLITQKQAAEEIGVTERQVRRLLRKLRRKGDRAVIHELRGRASNRKLSAELEQRAIAILSDPVYRGFGPTLAAEYLHKRHQITVSKETLRRMDGAGEVVESRPSPRGGGAPMAAAAEPLWRVGAVGHQHPRLAGGPRRADLPDLDDRRCHQPVVRALRAAGLERGEQAPVVVVPGAVWPPAGVLHGQGGHVPGGGQDQTAGAARRPGPAADAADAD